MVAALPARRSQRNFPHNALRGEIVIGQPPEVLLNGKPARLAPGARIRNQHNLIQMSGALLGRRLVVNYTLDGIGLSAATSGSSPTTNAPSSRGRRTAEEAASAGRFDPVAQALDQAVRAAPMTRRRSSSRPSAAR